MPQKGRIDEDNHLLVATGHSFFDAAQNTVGLQDCKCTLLTPVQLFIHWNPQILLSGTVLGEFSQPVHIPRIAPTQVQYLVVGLVDLHLFHMCLLFKLVHVTLDDISSFHCVNCTTLLGVMRKLAAVFFPELPTLSPYCIDDTQK